MKELSDSKRRELDLEKQVGDLRGQLAELHRQKATAISSKEEELARMRTEWLEDVCRRESDRAAMLSGFEAERATLREQLEISRRQDRALDAAVTASHSSADAPPTVKEAVSRAELAEQDGTSTAERFSVRSLELRNELEAATLEASNLERMRQDRLNCLEAESLDIRLKWERSPSPSTSAVIEESNPTSPEKGYGDGDDEASQIAATETDPGEDEVPVALPSFASAWAFREEPKEAPNSPPVTRLLTATSGMESQTPAWPCAMLSNGRTGLAWESPPKLPGTSP